MSEDRLDLRSLGEVDSPEVVSAALSEFRRKLLTRSLWVVAVLVAGGLMWAQVGRPDDLRERIERADGTLTLTNAVYEAGASRIGLDRVADLGDTVGLHLTALPEPRAGYGSGSRGPQLQVEAVIQSERLDAFDHWYEIQPPADGVVRVRVLGADCPGPKGCMVVIDLRALGVPATTWR